MALDDGVVGVSRHEKNSHARAEGADALGNITPACPGKNQIRKQQVNGSNFLATLLSAISFSCGK